MHFLSENVNVCVLIPISLKFISKGPMDNTSVLDQAIAGR